MILSARWNQYAQERFSRAKQILAICSQTSGLQVQCPTTMPRSLPLDLQGDDSHVCQCDCWQHSFPMFVCACSVTLESRHKQFTVRHIMKVPLTGRSAWENPYLFGSIIILHRLLAGLIRNRRKVNEQMVKISCLVQSFGGNRPMIQNKETKK